MYTYLESLQLFKILLYPQINSGLNPKRRIVQSRIWNIAFPLIATSIDLWKNRIQFIISVNRPARMVSEIKIVRTFRSSRFPPERAFYPCESSVCHAVETNLAKIA